MTDQLDSLEDWVAIKEHPFLDTAPKSYADFIVAYNTVEEKFSITCRERPRIGATEPTRAWSDIFSVLELSGIHDQLCLIHPSLGPYLPELPLPPSGMWAYMFAPPEFNETELCQAIYDYLRIAVDICGLPLVTDTIFEEHSYEEYFEKISELKRRKYDEALALAKDQLSNVLFLRDGSINMLDMSQVYVQEDEATFKLNVALAELYNYQIQPFLDMREIACTKLREAKSGLENPQYGDRRKAEFRVMFTEWQENYVDALDRIQQLYIEYYSHTVELQKGKSFCILTLLMI
jgi:hypothetical protein